MSLKEKPTFEVLHRNSTVQLSGLYHIQNIYVYLFSLSLELKISPKMKINIPSLCLDVRNLIFKKWAEAKEKTTRVVLRKAEQTNIS